MKQEQLIFLLQILVKGFAQAKCNTMQDKLAA